MFEIYPIYPKKKRLPKERKLVNLEVEEVSLVDRAANLQKFFIIKADGTLAADLKKLFGSEAEELLLQEVPEENAARLQNAVGEFAKYASLFPGHLYDSFKDLIRLAIGAPAAQGRPSDEVEGEPVSDEEERPVEEKAKSYQGEEVELGAREEAVRGQGSGLDGLLLRTIVNVLPAEKGARLMVDTLKAEARKMEKAGFAEDHELALVAKHFGLVLSDDDKAVRTPPAVPMVKFASRKSIDGQDISQADNGGDLWPSMILRA